jgi:2-keto-4-pentenoate hydratase/2-oxohepta-3-ene-1,7-dioic acid hydratase in catechol pathway
LKLVHFVEGNSIKVGMVDGGDVCDIVSSLDGGTLGESAMSLDSILKSGLLETIIRDAKPKKAKRTPLSSVELKSPLLNPDKILLIASNYAAHSKESKVVPPSFPYFFTKFRNAIVGPGEPIIIPRASQKVDWEVELAVVIGKIGKNIPKNHALDHVAAYAISNDVSYRDFQFTPSWPAKLDPPGFNWVKGKGMDFSFPFGPWLVTKDEISDPENLEISLSVNGVQKQKANTNDMMFKIADQIEYLSNGMTLVPGDIISTGTPAGVGMGTGGPYLKDGDIVESRVEKIGILRNPVRNESSTDIAK